MSPAVPWLDWVLAAALLLFLGGFLFSALHGAAYSRALAAMLSILALLHPAFVDAGHNVGSILFALVVCGIGVTALAFVRRQDPRRIILLGTSLATAQLVSPVCGLLSTLSMSMALRNVLVSKQAAQTTGQILSVLFIPAFTAAMLICVWLTQGHPSLVWTGSAAYRRQNLADFAGPPIAMAPLLFWMFAKRRRMAEAAGAVGALCGIVVATGTADSWLGLGQTLDVTSAVGPLAVVALSNSRRAEMHTKGDVLLIPACATACWLSAELTARVLGV